MSDDYAAVVVSVIAAVLVVGFIEIHALMKWLVARGQAIYLEAQAAIATNISSIRAGAGPSPQQLGHLYRIRGKAAARKRMARLAAPVVVWILWTAICLRLALTLCEVLLWTATDNHGKDPDLARDAFVHSCLGFLALLVTALARAVAHFFTEVAAYTNPIKVTTHEYQELLGRLDTFLAAQGEPPWRPWAPFGLRWLARLIDRL